MSKTQEVLKKLDDRAWFVLNDYKVHGDTDKAKGFIKALEVCGVLKDTDYRVLFSWITLWGGI